MIRRDHDIKLARVRPVVKTVGRIRARNAYALTGTLCDCGRQHFGFFGSEESFFSGVRVDSSDGNGCVVKAKTAQFLRHKTNQVDVKGR